MKALSLLAVGLAWAVRRRAPAHHPLALALTTAKLLELVRPSLPARPAMALLLALPALSAWSTLRALAWRRVGAACALAWLGAAAWVMLWAPPAVWSALWPGALAVAAGLELRAWAAWRRSGRAIGVTQRTAAVLVAGDVVGLVMGCVWGWTAPLAEGVALTACVVQGGWLWTEARSRSADPAEEELEDLPPDGEDDGGPLAS